MQHRILSALVSVLCIQGSRVLAADQEWAVQDGLTRVAIDHNLMAGHSELVVAFTDGKSQDASESSMVLDVADTSTLLLNSTRGILDESMSGVMRHEAGLTLSTARTEVSFSDFALAPSASGFVVRPEGDPSSRAVLEMVDIKLGFDRPSQTIYLESAELRISRQLAAALGEPSLAGASIGSLTSRAFLMLTSGEPMPDPGRDADGGVAGGNNGTDCWNAGEPLFGPDVIVGVLYNVANYTKLGTTDAFSFGTVSCNIGSSNLSWVSSTNQHPVIGQNVYRLKNGRFEQVGQAWLKHGFTALTNNDCGCGCNGVGGSQLGIGCSDPYSAGLNGGQDGLGPKFEVNPHTGFFSYPYTEGNQGATGDSIYKRVQIAVADIDTAQNPGASYFCEGHYVTPDDAASANQNNNASYRQITFSDGNSDGDWDVALGGTSTTMREQPGIRAWKDSDSTVTETDVQVSNDGLVIVSSKATSVGGGFFHYEYAVQNLNCERAIGSFIVPMPSGTTVQNVGFHDVNYHSGEPFSGTDWTPTVGSTTVSWATTLYGTNPNANALRWGTLYNFRFDANVAPITLNVTLGIFKPGSPSTVVATAIIPAGAPPVCGNNTVEPGEECDPPNGVHCDATCQWICGDSVTQSGEQCDDSNTVNNDGCTNNCTLPICGDGIVQASNNEQCDDGNTIPNDGCTNSCHLPACGDGVTQPQIGEQCDDGNTVSGDGCSATCQSESNNFCTGGATITNGSTAFSTVNATTDGPVPTCQNNALAANDIWYNYTATCNGSLTVSTCNTASFDTVIVIYNGCACSNFNQLGCFDDSGGCGNTTTLTVAVTQGNCYKIRLGGYTGSSRGSGTVTVSCTGPICGNSILDAGEECDPPNGTTCDANCQRIPVCGDGLIDGGETCDDSNTLSGDGCSPFCLSEGPASNNNCANAIAIGEGTRGFNTVGASTDGPNETLGNCSKFSYTQVGNDVWFCYTPTCTGIATASLCGANYDSKVAIYNGCTCPAVASSIACNDDHCGYQSETPFNVAIGNSYLIRIGGYNAATGGGPLNVTCAPVGCQSNADCADTNLCTTDICNAGSCVHQNNSIPCDDGNDCTTNDACSGGSCVGGVPPNCPGGSSNCTDCNINNIRDDCENLADCDNNDFPDICEYADCNNNGIADICDIFNGTEVDCDGGPIGNKADGATRFNSLCVFCHGQTGMGGFGPNIQNHTRVQIWNMLLPPTDHPGGAHPEYSQQDFANLEAFLAQAGSRGRPDRIPDSCQTLADCNQDGASDGCELESGTQVDSDYNGIPDTCVCQTNADCDDGLYCNGGETCVAGACVPGTPPCSGANCNESKDECGDCTLDSDCDDGSFCTGQESCVSGHCQPGSDPCPGQLCSETANACVECLSNADCDDGVFCNGAEICDGGICVPGLNPCPSATCYEPSHSCIPNSCDPPTVVAEGCRYLKVMPASGSGAVALLVRGDASNPNVDCVVKYVQVDGTLGAAPIYRTPAQWGAVDVRGAAVLPSTLYEVAVDCGVVGSPVMSTSVTAITWKYGDTANDGNVNLDDILCTVSGFSGAFGAPPLCQRTGVDLVGCTPDTVVNLDDILAVLGAFSGASLNCPIPCP